MNTVGRVLLTQIESNRIGKTGCLLPRVELKDSIVFRDPLMKREAMRASLRIPDGRRKYANGKEQTA